MDGTLELVEAPAIEPITLEEAKDWARITHAEDDTLVDGLITTARAHVEEVTGRALLTQTWDYWLDEFPCDEIAVPRPKLQSVTYLKYIDADGVLQTLAGTEYTVDAKRTPARIVPAYGKSWPTARCVPNAVNVRFVAGYGDTADDVPMQLKHAVGVLVATLYEQREMETEAALTQVPMAFWQLVNQHRVFWT